MEKEDDKLNQAVKKYGTENWSLIAQEVESRNGKQCRERYCNHLNPILNKEEFTMAEDNFIIQQQNLRGNAWATIAKFLPGRSANGVKNRFTWLIKHRPSLYPPMNFPQFIYPFSPPNLINIQNHNFKNEEETI
jgi:hypothetical protein